LTFTAEQQKEMNRIAAAAKREGQEAAERKMADEAQAAKDERNRKAAEERGEYDKVKASIEAERDTEKKARVAAEKRMADYVKDITPDVTARWDALPDEVKPLYPGADDDVLGKAAFLTRVAPLAAKLAGTSGVVAPALAGGTNPPTPPRPAAAAGRTLEEDIEEARKSGQYPRA